MNGKFKLRGDIYGPWECELYGEIWLQFNRAVVELSDKLVIHSSAAEAKLHKLCASGVIRAIGGDPNDGDPPEPIPPSEWSDDDLPTRLDVLVSNIDFYNWLNQQPTQPTAGGKQSRIIRLLAVMFPDGVPSRGDCPRELLRATLLKRDPTLTPLDLKTLQRAIEAYNRQLGNARNTSVSQ